MGSGFWRGRCLNRVFAWRWGYEVSCFCLCLFFCSGGLGALGKSFALLIFREGASISCSTILCQLFGDRLSQPWNPKAQERT